MLLAFDIGNTSVKVAIFKDSEKINFGVFPKDDFLCNRDILALTTRSNLRYDQFDKIIIASVVPSITNALTEYIKVNFIVEPIIINNNTPLSIKIDEAFKEEIGADILVMSSYAYGMFKDECLIVSLGTASVISYVTSEGVLKGCAIAPGLDTFTKSLTEHAAMLPDFTPKYMFNYLSTDTKEAMSIGAFNGYIGMINDLIRNIRKQYCYNQKIILCGGNSDIFKDYISDVDYQENNFVINGINYIATHNV